MAVVSEDCTRHVPMAFESEETEGHAPFAFDEGTGNIRPATAVADMVSVYRAGERFPSFLSDPVGFKDVTRIPGYLPRVVVAMMIYCGGMFLNCVSQAFLQKTMDTYYETRWQPRPPYTGPVLLWDVVHANFPMIDSEKHPWLDPDFLAWLGPTFIMVRFWILPGPMSLRWTVLCRWFTLLGVLFFFRSFSIISTVLPNPDDTCEPRTSHPNHLLIEAWSIFTHKDLTCQDVLFSGHTVAITLSGLFIMEYVPKSPWFAGSLLSRHKWLSTLSILNIACSLYLVVGWYVVSATHFHYTADVFLGALMSILIFKTYHSAIKMVPMNCHRTWSVYPFLSWFEQEALDVQLWHLVAARRSSAMKEADARTTQMVETEAQRLQERGHSKDAMQHLVEVLTAEQ